jgi:hypothetical protein
MVTREPTTIPSRPRPAVVSIVTDDGGMIGPGDGGGPFLGRVGR